MTDNQRDRAIAELQAQVAALTRRLDQYAAAVAAVHAEQAVPDTPAALRRTPESKKFAQGGGTGSPHQRKWK